MRTGLIGAVLLVAGAVAALLGALPPAALAELVGRTAPVLLFVAAISVVTGLAAEAGLFRALGELAVRGGHRRAWLLWLLVAVLAVLCTVFLSLDTTAVLLTPVVIALVGQAGLPPLPFALTTVWLANTASLLLPVSNLTNLLAADRIGSIGDFVPVTALPAAACVVVPCVVLVVFFRRDLARRYIPAAPTAADDRPLLLVCGVVVLLLLGGLVSGIAVWIPTSIAAVVLLAVFAVRRRAAIRLGLVPWPVLLFAAGLFVAATVVDRLGAAEVLDRALPTGQSAVALTVLGGAGLLGANLIDNLPAYLALEPVAGHAAERLVAVLIGVNAGPLITPWASLATLLWARSLHAAGVRVPWRRVVGLGAVAAPLTVAAGVAALVLLPA